MIINKNEKIDKNTVLLEIEVDTAKFEDGLQKSYIKNMKHFNVAGFRKGKVPRKIVEKNYGVEVLYEDAVNFVMSEAYDKAIEQTGLKPVDAPEVDFEDIQKDKNFVFTAKITVKPEVVVENYKGVKAEKKEYPVTDDDIFAEIKKLQEKNSRMVTIEDRAVKMGDHTVIDFAGFDGDVAFEGGTGTDYPLEIGSNSFIPGFEDQLVGAKLNEEISVNVTFPEDYHAENLSGKPVVFHVTVKEIKFKEMPEVDDEFAKDVSEFDTLSELKNDIKATLEKANAEKSKSEFENSVMGKVVESVEIEIPQVMIDKQINHLVEDFGMRVRSQGIELEQYLKFTGMDMEAFRQQFKLEAQNQVKTTLVVEAVAQQENIVPSDEDVEQELKTMSEAYNIDVDKIRKIVNVEDLKNDIRNTKAAKLILDRAVAI